MLRHPLLRGVAGLVMLIWPLLIWLGFHYGILNWLLSAMTLLLVLQCALRGRQRHPLQLIPVAALILCASSLLLRQHQLLLYYPVVINSLLFLLFSLSLLSGTPIVERIARLREPDLPPTAVRYTRQVTQVWCLFFIVNGTMALLTCLHADMTLWALWNGMISYILIGVLMAGEWLVRRRVRARAQI
ncbi:MAG: hypothetical protein ACRC5A_12480 [Enterobacteriaceae bacterium]